MKPVAPADFDGPKFLLPNFSQSVENGIPPGNVHTCSEVQNHKGETEGSSCLDNESSSASRNIRAPGFSS